MSQIRASWKKFTDRLWKDQMPSLSFRSFEKAGTIACMILMASDVCSLGSDSMARMSSSLGVYVAPGVWCHFCSISLILSVVEAGSNEPVDDRTIHKISVFMMTFRTGVCCGCKAFRKRQEWVKPGVDSGTRREGRRWSGCRTRRERMREWEMRWERWRERKDLSIGASLNWELRISALQARGKGNNVYLGESNPTSDESFQFRMILRVNGMQRSTHLGPPFYPNSMIIGSLISISASKKPLDLSLYDTRILWRQKLRQEQVYLVFQRLKELITVLEPVSLERIKWN